MILLYEVPRVVRFLETESRRCLLGTKKGERNGSYCPVGVEFQFGKMKRVPGHA